MIQPRHQNSPTLARSMQTALRQIRLIGALLLAGMTLGCGTATPYGPAIDGKGYSQRQVENDRYRISFAGNSLTPRDTVETYLLYRAAEITLQSGNDHFRVVDQDTEAETTYYDTVTTPPGVGFYGSTFYDRRATHYRRYHHSFPYAYRPFGRYDTITSHPVTRYEAIANIIVFSTDRSESGLTGEEDHSYDARDVIMRLGPTIIRPEPPER